MCRLRPLLPLVLLGAAALALGACRALVVPPPDPPDPVTIYVVEYRHLHTGLLVPRGADDWLEYGYGEMGWYARREDAFYDALPAMLWDTPGALSRREVRVTPERSLAAQFDLTEMMPVVVARTDVDALLEELERIWSEHEGERIHHEDTGRDFIGIDREYSMSYNCNDAVAEWLRRLRCEVEERGVLGGFEIHVPPAPR